MSSNTGTGSAAPPSHDVANSALTNFGIARVPGFDGDYEAIELHLLGRQFLKAAGEITGSPSAAHYVLLIHSIEVALKGFLHLKGVILDDLADKYGHKLDRLLKDAVEKGLIVSNPHTTGIIEKLNEGAKKARIRYNFAFRMPLLPDVMGVAESLLADTNPPIPSLPDIPLK